MLTLEQYLEASSDPTRHNRPEDPRAQKSSWGALVGDSTRVAAVGETPTSAAVGGSGGTDGDLRFGAGGWHGGVPRRFKVALALVLVVVLGLAAARTVQSRGLASRDAPNFESLGQGERLEPVGVDGSGASGADISGWRRSGGSTNPKSLGVHVAGAVAAPGVYYLEDGRRVVDALEAAGGATSEADLAKVNLAAPLSDGAFVYIPKTGEEGSPPIEASPGQTATSSESKSTKVNVNKAPVSELEKLPGIGPTLAQRIVESRSSQGPFRSLADLRRVPGIGDAKIAQMAPNVVF